MFVEPLPKTAKRAAGAIHDQASCDYFLSQLQLTDVRIAHATLLKELNHLNRLELAGQSRFRILETLRETLLEAQDKYSQKLPGRSLPLDSSDRSILDGVAAMWGAMVTGYRHCLEGASQGSGLRLLALQRCLRCTGSLVLEYARACHEFDLKLWGQLHGLYLLAEAEGVAEKSVEDPQASGGSSTCRTTYVEALLACQADPVEMNRGQMAMVLRWLNQWSPLVGLLKAPPQRDEGVACLAVYLRGYAGLQAVEKVTISDTTRYLDLSDLSKTLRVKLVLIAQGQPPESLDLGRECVQPACGALIQHLQRHWCEGSTPRLFERRPAVGEAHVCFGIEDIWVNVSGTRFSQPARGGEPTDAARRKMEAFGAVAAPVHADVRDLPGETWLVKDESVLGLRLERASEGARVRHNELVAVQLPSAPFHMAGVIRWIVVTLAGTVQMGLRAFPGEPKAVAARVSGPGTSGQDKYAPALLLPEVASLQVPPSLVTPVGFFAGGRLADIQQDGANRRVRFDLLVERGATYERISFTDI